MDPWEGAKLFVGLGFPFEGPSPIEALQAGCYFINPIWDPPIGRSLNGTKNKDYIKGFFNNKPTLRALSSQVPYLAALNDAQSDRKIINTKLKGSKELELNFNVIKQSKGQGSTNKPFYDQGMNTPYVNPPKRLQTIDLG